MGEQLMRIWWLALVSVCNILCFTILSEAITLENVKEKGELHCGVSTGIPGFSNPDEKGMWTGIDVDFCRAVAAAALGDANKVKYLPLTTKQRFPALQTGEIDVLSMSTTWTMTRDTSLALNFVGVSYYDGQGFMVNKKVGVTSALELDGREVCIQAETTNEKNLADFFEKHKMGYKPIFFDTAEQVMAGFKTGSCEVITSDQSLLYALRTKLADPQNAVILPEIISKEPLGPVVRQGDDGWFNLVRWTLFILINAEELGVSSENVDDMKSSTHPNVRRLLGLDGIGGKGLGLDNEWAYRVIKQVGNYSEIFERNVGQNSPLKIERGLNALWNRGGIQYAPPVL
jgi:general L-amino acid transport system substrate-binding protein